MDEFEKEYLSFSNEELHLKLSQVDKEMSLKYHPNQRRKVLRSLQIFQQKNIKQSDLIEKQSMECKYDALIFWLGCDEKVLTERIRDRTHLMFQNGALEELRNLNEQLISCGFEDFYKSKGGLLQSIGFKEFQEYLFYLKQNQSQIFSKTEGEDVGEKREEKGKEILKNCIEKLNLHTIKYAKKQILWIKNRIQTRGDIPLFYLDSSCIHQWDLHVFSPAKEIVLSFVDNQILPHHHLRPKKIEKTTDKISETFECEYCKKKIWGNFQIKKHLQSKSHQKRKKKMSMKK